MPIASIIVRANWDDDAGVWVATSKNIDGLAVEAPTLEALEPKVLAALSDLIELNGIESDLPEIPVHIMAEQLLRIPNPATDHGWSKGRGATSFARAKAITRSGSARSETLKQAGLPKAF
jgi:hypothetical protein